MDQCGRQKEGPYEMVETGEKNGGGKNGKNSVLEYWIWCVGQRHTTSDCGGKIVRKHGGGGKTSGEVRNYSDMDTFLL